MRLVTTGIAVVGLLGAAASGAPISSAATPAATAGGNTRLISTSGTASFTPDAAGTPTGVEAYETAGFGNAGVQGPDRSHSGGGGTSVGAITQPRAVTTSAPDVVTSFDGLNHFQNRFGADHGNQFSLEPPDQGLCVGTDGQGNTRVVEALNDVMRVYDGSGNPLTAPQALNPFFGYPSAIVRSTHPVTFGKFVTDPSCLFDAATGRWFVDVLTLDTFPHPDKNGFQDFQGTNHLDLAVSKTSDPAGSWTIYSIPVQDDGTDGTPNHHCSDGSTQALAPTNPNACFGDYPHIGSDANGVYLTTNEYSFFGPEFHGAQIYAFSKAQLVSGAATLSVTQFDTHGLDTFGFALNGFTLWPSQTPGGGGDATAQGSEYFLSSNSAAEAHDTGNGKSGAQPSTQLLAWALTNTSSLTAAKPTLALSNTKVDVGLYAAPPAATQKAGQQPLRDCLNNNPCSLFLEGIKDPFAETAADLDSNDTRMQQVTFVNGRLWGALDTALSVSSNKQAGVEWFSVAPSTGSGSVTATLDNQGYVGLGNDNLTYPAIGLNSAGKGVMAFTLVGSDFYPSAGYALIDNSGIGTIHVAAAGQGPDDGFTNYKLFGNPPGTTRPRWGDYGAAVALGGNVWIASEYIGQSCSLSEYRDTNFRCGNTRTALANWDTRISEIAIP